MKEIKMVTIAVNEIYQETAKLSMLKEYEERAIWKAGNGNDVILTGLGSVWLYLRLAHALHDKARSLSYDSPVNGPVVIFNHDPH